MLARTNVLYPSTLNMHTINNNLLNKRKDLLIGV
jgi:hypothetical protein